MIDRIIIENLELIRKELVPNCKHPKKMMDRTADGQWYCMNCNYDISSYKVLSSKYLLNIYDSYRTKSNCKKIFSKSNC